MLPRAAAIRETTPVTARNSEIASVFGETAGLLEIEGGSPFAFVPIAMPLGCCVARSWKE
jgi:hypothetical protein